MAVWYSSVPSKSPSMSVRTISEYHAGKNIGVKAKLSISSLLATILRHRSRRPQKAIPGWGQLPVEQYLIIRTRHRWFQIQTLTVIPAILELFLSRERRRTSKAAVA
ncbi:hypothetical protein BJX70DRAFT_361849 [Aspergillus crustosus]